MKKLAAALLVLALLTPSVSFALVPQQQLPGGGTPFLPTDDVIPGSNGGTTYSSTATLAASGQVVGCNVTGLGGALGQTFAAALQQAVPGFIRNQLSGPLNKLAAKAGPFGGVVSAIGNIAISKLSNFVQGKIGEFANKLFGGTVAQAIGISGLGAVAGVGLAEVPVRDSEVRSTTNTIKTHTDTIQQAQKLDQDRKCVGNPLVNKIKNALLSLLFKSTIDFINGGFNGQGALIQNVHDFFAEGIDAVMQDFLSNQLSGICSPMKQQTQILLLTQYQYETDLGKRSQCGLTSQEASDKSKGITSYETFMRSAWDPSLSDMGTFYTKLDEEQQRIAQYRDAQVMRMQTDGPYRDHVICDETGQDSSIGGADCPGGTYHTVADASLYKAQLQATLNQPRDQLLNADEIGELIDAVTASVTQVALQGVDGLMGLSKKQGSQGSYLDAMVGETTGVAQGAAQNAIGSDIANAIAVETEYRDTIDSVVQNLTATRSAYAATFTCYQGKSALSTTAQQKMDNATSTIATVLDPQIKSLTALKNASQDSIDQLEIIAEQAQTALTQDDIIAVNQSFIAFTTSGAVHTATDLTFLQNDLAASLDFFNLLSTDSTAQLSECQAL